MNTVFRQTLIVPFRFTVVDIHSFLITAKHFLLTSTFVTDFMLIVSGMASFYSAEQLQKIFPRTLFAKDHIPKECGSFVVEISTPAFETHRRRRRQRHGLIPFTCCKALSASLYLQLLIPTLFKLWDASSIGDATHLECISFTTFLPF